MSLNLKYKSTHKASPPSPHKSKGKSTMAVLWSPAVHPKQGPKVTADMLVTGGLASSSYPATASSTSP